MALKWLELGHTEVELEFGFELGCILCATDLGLRFITRFLLRGLLQGCL